LIGSSSLQSPPNETRSEIIYVGPRSRLGRSTSRKDGMKFDRLGNPIREQPNEITLLELFPATPIARRNNAHTCNSRRDRGFVGRSGQSALNSYTDLSAFLLERP
jgi:hypothetical protein